MHRALRPIAIPTATAAGLIAAALLSACANTQDAAAMPDAIKAGRGERLAMVVPAKGVQIYECRRKKDGDAFEWAFVAPDAELFDARGNLIGLHNAGPAWVANDGSRVTGKVMAKADAPDTASIPWLLLEAKNAGSPGSFSKVTRIQRVNTTGGVAPAKPCNGPMLGQQMGVHYTADYRFFVSLSN